MKKLITALVIALILAISLACPLPANEIEVDVYAVAAYNAPMWVQDISARVCDGKDDHVEIQDAIDSGDMRGLSQGVFKTTEPIQFPQEGRQGSYYWLRGQGAETVIWYLGDDYAIKLVGASAGNNDQCYGHGLEKLMVSGLPISAGLIEMKWAHRCAIRDVQYGEARNGIALYMHGPAYGNLIEQFVPTHGGIGHIVDKALVVDGGIGTSMGTLFTNCLFTKIDLVSSRQNQFIGGAFDTLTIREDSPENTFIALRQERGPITIESDWNRFISMHIYDITLAPDAEDNEFIGCIMPEGFEVKKIKIDNSRR